MSAASEATTRASWDRVRRRNQPVQRDRGSGPGAGPETGESRPSPRLLRMSVCKLAFRLAVLLF
jgi:hypothetical protein